MVESAGTIVADARYVRDSTGRTGEFAIAVKNAMSGLGYDPRLSAAAQGMGSAVPSDGGFAVPMSIPR